MKLPEAICLKVGDKVRVDPDSPGDPKLNRIAIYEVTEIDYVRRDIRPSEIAIGRKGVHIFSSYKSDEFSDKHWYESASRYLRRKGLYDGQTLTTNVLLDVRDVQRRSKAHRFGYAWFVRA